jgi:hypothetical protein
MPVPPHPRFSIQYTTGALSIQSSASISASVVWNLPNEQVHNRGVRIPRVHRNAWIRLRTTDSTKTVSIILRRMGPTSQDPAGKNR